MAHEVSAALVVESGVHHAARAELTAGLNRVGRSTDNDIIISDLQMPETSFALECRGREVELRAGDAEIELVGRKPLARGASRSCVNGLRFTSAGITFRIEIAATDSAAPAESGRSSFGWRLPAVATSVLATIILAVLVSFRAAPLTARPNNVVTTTSSIPPASGQGVASSQSRQQFALEQLRRHLAAVDLGSLVLTAQPDGSIEARGQISKAQETAWREVGHWFDSMAGGQAVLVDAVTISAEVQPLAIQAVWLGQNPYVIDDSGDKLFVGSALPSGWTISGIDRSHVVVKRGDQILAVRF
jgi:hypothetical protein